MEYTTAGEDPDNGQRALEQLTTGVTIGAWVVIGILVFTAFAIAMTVYAANKLRQAELLDDEW